VALSPKTTSTRNTLIGAVVHLLAALRAQLFAGNDSGWPVAT